MKTSLLVLSILCIWTGGCLACFATHNSGPLGFAAVFSIIFMFEFGHLKPTTQDEKTKPDALDDGRSL